MAVLRMRGFLSATVSQAASIFVPFRMATREFHGSCRMWEGVPTKQQHARMQYEYVSSLPLKQRNPTKMVLMLWIILAPVAIGCFFLAKSHVEKKRLRMMKLQREMNASIQKD